jgi:hypothetical protein
MPGPSAQRLVLVTWAAEAAGGQDAPRSPHRVGSGYFVTSTLVLTACHVAPEDASTPVSVRVENGEPRWREQGRVVWRDESLDAALIEVFPPLPDATADVHWSELSPAENSTWNSTGYPEASYFGGDGNERERKSAGLDGTLYVQGGGGQGPKELELGVNNPPPFEEWSGVSGAPVFVGDKLIGMVKSAAFNGRRLYGVAAHALLQNVGFRRAIESAWLDLPKMGPWLLVLLSEAGAEDLVSTVKGSLERHEEAIAKEVGQSLHLDRVVAVRVTDALDTPEHWLKFVEALCAAPLMIADVTGFEPGVILALGVRGVVRRGVTIASTANPLDEEELSALPFNIQETKLISHGDADPNITDQDPRYSLNIIATAVLNGLRELRINPRYLDLPAYDAVRCPAPESPTEQQRARETVLVLCSFHKEYAPNWLKLSDALAKRYPAKQTVRMRDIASPRLVGQALYESIRWTKTCVVDWTHWRANVFFEFGVRLACSSLEPVCVLEEPDNTAPLAQKEMLLRLFGPTRYALPDLRPALHGALTTHELQKALKEGDSALARALARVPHNGTYSVALASFEYAQDRVTISPHDLLRSSVEALLGKDRQKTGETPVLFASNPAFARELRRSVRERWIAAWHYLRNRYSEDELRRDARLLGELKQLGETLFQEVRDDPGDPSIAELRATVIDLIDTLDEDSDAAEK